MPRLRLAVAYDGASFKGFQRQPNVETVQGLLEVRLSKLCGESIAVTGAGRTDAGVHARAQVIHFDTECGIPLDRLAPALNATLGSAVRVWGAEQAPEGFHARYSATEREYEYLVARQVASPFRTRYVAEYPGLRADAAERMAEALAASVGRFDFLPFSVGGDEGRGTVRTIRVWRVTEREGLLRLRVAADGFLRSMVRLMVGLALEIGEGKQDPDAVAQVLGAGSRAAAGRPFAAAPPQGLYLTRVEYPDGYAPRPDEFPGGDWEAACGAGPPGD